MEPERQRICERIDQIQEKLHEVSEYLKANPETAFEEFKARDFLSARLEEEGFQVQKAVGGLETSFVAKPGGAPSKRPTMALLAEYDALPKIGHGCGHNMIAAASLGAALALKDTIGDLAASLILVGTPAEEGAAGKAIMAQNGAFDEVDAAIMFHPGDKNIAGSTSLGRTKFKVEFFGRTAHAAGSPDKGINALDAMILLFNGIGALRQQVKTEGLIHGIITHGGDAPNIIPDYSAGLFYVRARSLDYRDELYDKVARIAEAAALATGASFKVEAMLPKLDPRKRNPALEGIIKANMTMLGLAIDKSDGRMGSSDSGNLSQVIPVAHPYLAIVDPDDGINGHSVEFCQATTTERGREVLLKAAKLLALTAYDYLTSEESRQQIRDDFLKKNDDEECS
ncbi:MAG: M20 family metallopeptidase [Desulfarculaceae bacterium]|jgi:amidohydrolase